jgi:hypothetical protein
LIKFAENPAVCMRRISILTLYVNPLTQRHGSGMQTLHDFSRQTRPARPAARLLPVQHLVSGATCMLLSETSRDFEDRPRFGPAFQPTLADSGSQASAAEWMAHSIARFAGLAEAEGLACPLLVPAPLAALLHDDTAMVCHAVVERMQWTPQDLFLDVSASSLLVEDVLPRLAALRRLGFRLSISTRPAGPVRLASDRLDLIDSLRFDVRQLDSCPELIHLVEAARAGGTRLIAEHSAWRDGDWLARLGVHHAIRPRADA